jgi:asparagine synthase (glutamine-hydrolysing)
MCGIAGIWNLSGRELSKTSLQKFTDSIAHRGPNGAGYELIENNTIGFGHRRLSILDLSEAGKQPMFSHDRNFLVSFNGEVYNFIEIRKELQSLGYHFKTETDTEVILCAYEKWGIDSFQRFNGMFAIAIWDFKAKELLLIRDRFGVKPLYFLYEPGELFAFCSETLAFKYLDGFNRELHEKNFNLALQQAAVLEGSDKTIFKNIHQLLPGHFLKFKSGESFVVKQWWNTQDNLVKVPQSYNEQIEEFRFLFEDACKLRMRSDVTLASALSGGLDSSSVYCSLQKIQRENQSVERVPDNWQQAFVATFPNTSVDEKPYAEEVVKYINGKAHYITPDYSHLTEDIIKSTRLLDGIISTPLISISDIYKAMRQNGVTVSMDGHGVDEMMYGYNTYVFQAFYDAIHKKDFSKADDYAQILCGLSPDYKIIDFQNIIKGFDKNIFEKGMSFLKNRLSSKNNTNTQSENGTSWLNFPDQSVISEIMAAQNSPVNWSNSEKVMYDDFHYKSLPINLRDFDRAAMQHGIEIRMPFMDYRLVSYVFSLPQESKIGGGYTKRILRDAMKNTLPENIRTRTLKIGIGAPMVEWFNGDLKEFVLDTLHSNSFKDSAYWNGRQIATDLEDAYKHNTLNKPICSNAWAIINAHIIINDKD